MRLPASLLDWIEDARGDTKPSDYIIGLLKERMEQNQRLAQERTLWLALGRKQYTKEVCRQTLELNEEFPIHEG